VYVAGYNKNAKGEMVAKVWKNGREHQCLGRYANDWANSVFVSGDDVYVAGTCSPPLNDDFGVIWKNGKLDHGYVGGNKANSVFVVGDDVYVAGELGFLHYCLSPEQKDESNAETLCYNKYKYRNFAVVWKNERDVQQRLNDGECWAAAYSVVVADDDLYVVGAEQNSTRINVATLWKNGEVKYRLSDGEHNAEAMCVFVAGESVYAAGYEEKKKDSHTAILWQNGKVKYRLSDVAHDGKAYSVFVSGDDVYVAGYEENPKKIKIPVLWKNGEVVCRLGKRNGVAHSVSVYGNDVYVAGWAENPNRIAVATLWKNGKVQHRLSDGVHDGRAHSVFVKER
jgi:hypothetical protein